jgi:NAD(P)-dependent dehydrogenase (short-subunit alcohol dehydrogenase family)
MPTTIVPNLSGRTAVVTGGTSGIGLEIARGLAARGARTVVVGRGKARAAQACAEIVRSLGTATVEPVAVTDLALLSDVRELARTLLERYPQVHVLVNNAGVYLRRREVTSEGHERTFALNVLAPFLLTSLLSDRLRASAPARVVNVSSTAHRGQTVDFSDLESAKRFSGFRVYGRSKLELLLLSRELARRFQGTGVTVNAVHPGFVASGFGRNNGGATAVGFRLIELLFAINVRRGAETPLFVASDPSVAAATGEYFARSRLARASPAAGRAEDARRLYDICRELTNAPALSPAGSEGATSR